MAKKVLIIDGHEGMLELIRMVQPKLAPTLTLTTMTDEAAALCFLQESPIDTIVLGVDRCEPEETTKARFQRFSKACPQAKIINYAIGSIANEDHLTTFFRLFAFGPGNMHDLYCEEYGTAKPLP